MEESLKVGIAGLGTVGSSVVRILREKANSLTCQCGRSIKVVAVSARDKSRNRGIDLSDVKWFDSPVEMASSDEIDVFVELIGGESDVVYAAVKKALETGHHVVTANKALLAQHGGRLAVSAEKKGVFLHFEAAVAGGIPIIKVMRESLVSNHISRIYGILNGTCNYILTRMFTEGLSFKECLEDAQRLGYAEVDPTFDIGGDDTAHKLALLTSLAFGTAVSLDDIYVEGISNISQIDIRAADELGYRIKLLGVALKTETGIEQRVHPTMVPTSSMIAQIHGVTNALSIQSDLLGELLLSGPGAGGTATASAVIGDLADIAKARPGFQYAPVLGRPALGLAPHKKARISHHAGGYFIRLNVHDRAGVFAAVAKHMAGNHISLESIVQRSFVESQSMKTIILITHETTEVNVQQALAAIEKDGHLVAKSQFIRIEPMV
ncbi:homoserine dehydrogenase [Bartonella henselae]|uniref:Homoserine dehydrogenase n=1 Tax=Bartonella henselae TaxID=38323 RepID=X5LZW3_BARHN|nr:homoserine dehydrogenase [Bartonella henselae]MDM9997021.1 homoserine dehydrogenase [Bartonella henselae]OLL48669.1 homoserine dehydrogenase [Bartonella henselae]OLL51482.1 homoserine dehydrogenase [Bartonella henselae]OLL51913.1 homoserine dehydrogenase [Bartonella henselae]OLL54600.1 homoserine dehydrogenase [Bartonella henselae]